MEPITIKSEIDRLLKLLSDTDPSGTGYEKIADNLRKLVEMDTKQVSNRPSPDAWLNAATTILLTVAVLQYERLGVISSKAFSWIGRRFV